MIGHLRLPLDFAPDAMQADLARIPARDWIPHFNTGTYRGEWSGVALRGPAGATHPIQSLFANPGTTAWEDASLLDLCPGFSEVLSRFRCPLQSVRLLKLAPGAVIEPHTDHALGFEDGEVRLHVPVLTSPDVEFRLNGVRLHLDEGETWYVNVNLPHGVANRGAGPRVHLVIDCELNAWLRDLFANAGRLRRDGELRAET